MPITALKEAIQHQNLAFMAAIKAGDPTALGALYTEDAWLLPPGGVMVHGRLQIEAFWKSRFDRIAEVNLTTVDVVPLGTDAAREVGRAVILTQGHLAEEIAGKYMVVWRHVGGEWKLEADMWNNNG
jgi:uncharacterized protein (TIGR02246 family)